MPDNKNISAEENTPDNKENTIEQTNKKTSKKKKSTTLKPVNPEDKPLTDRERAFVNSYVIHKNATQAYKDAGFQTTNENSMRRKAIEVRTRVNVNKQIQLILKKEFESQMASGEEVMAYLAAVVRGEIKDQFGLDASISERTRAALEIARRTIDFQMMMENQNKEKSSDNTIKIQFDWNRENKDS